MISTSSNLCGVPPEGQPLPTDDYPLKPSSSLGKQNMGSIAEMEDEKQMQGQGGEK